MMKNGDRVYLKPANGLKVRNPDRDGRHLHEDGEHVTLNTFWRRRLADGDVSEARPPKPAKPAPAAEPKKED